MTRIREARADDAEALAGLATQLGYPGTPDQLRDRLHDVARTGGAAVFVSTDEADVPTGWILVEVQVNLTSDRMGHIGGLVVDEAARGAGIGLALLRRAEEWAVARGCRVMRLASRVARERAHRFYRREGYAVLKTSHVFEKRLDDGAHR